VPGVGPVKVTCPAAPSRPRRDLRPDTSTSRTGRGPANLATIRAVIAAIKQVGHLHVPKAGATIPPRLKPSASTASIRTDVDIHGTRRSPGQEGPTLPKVVRLPERIRMPINA
jgi:hypothetical protein